jgi:antitoxin CptB
MSLDAETLSRLRWGARRGLLENDLIIERFFGRYAQTLGIDDVVALKELFDLSDNDLLDLFLSRKEPEGELSNPGVKRVLTMLREV